MVQSRREMFKTAGAAAAPLKAKWHRALGEVTHTFTHFPLALIVYTARVARSTAAPQGTRWVRAADLANEALPNVMRKVIAHGLGL